MTAGGINQSVINVVVINGDTGNMLVNKAAITININKASSALINQPIINTLLINGLVTDNNIYISQTHVLTISDPTVSVVSTSPLPVMVFYLTPENAFITVTSKKVFLEKGQGGNLFVTLTEDDSTVHRFSFEGIKA
jgi:hypothetical protein